MSGDKGLQLGGAEAHEARAEFDGGKLSAGDEAGQLPNTHV
jgi:hypothetical protein